MYTLLFWFFGALKRYVSRFAPLSLPRTVLSPAANRAAASVENGRYFSHQPRGPIRAGFQVSQGIVEKASSMLPHPVVSTPNVPSVPRYRRSPLNNSGVGNVLAPRDPLRSVP